MPRVSCAQPGNPASGKPISYATSAGPIAVASYSSLVRRIGEGAPDVKGSANFNENVARPYTAEDIRFTTKGRTLYAFALAWPAAGKVTIKTLAKGSAGYPGEVGKVELLGSKGTLTFTRDASGLVVNLPEQKPHDYAYALKITSA